MMASFPVALILFILFNSISGYTLKDDYDTKEIYFPSEFHYRGEKIDMITQLDKTYDVWYSEPLNRSRIAFYGGEETKYYYANDGYVLDVHAITSPDLEIEIGCFLSLSDEMPDFLPDLSKFVYTGTEELDDKEVDVWKYEETEDVYDKKISTLYTHKNSDDEDIPVKLIFKKLNLDSGAVIRNFIINFHLFELTVSEEDLTYENVDDCSYFGKNFKKDIQFLKPDVHGHLDLAFDGYINHHNKKYKNKEHQIRKNIFHKNWRMVHKMNNKNVGYKLELNEFSDRTKEELSYLTGTFPSDPSKVEATPFRHTLEEIDQLVEELPESFDLRTEGYISKVKHQADCRSCWAFATTAAVEGVLARANGGQLYDLSEQSLVDCAWGYENMGCDGGTLAGALKYVVQYGMPKEEEYGSYLATDGYCRVGNMSNTFPIRGFSAVTPGHPGALKLALYKYGPVTVAIHASKTLVHYSSGIFYDFTCENKTINHGVTVVGYGVRDGDEYWIVKNSYGEAWGEGGYVLFANKNNNCLLLSTPYYPYV